MQAHNKDEITQGLQMQQASILPKYFYDPLGSRLFEAICDLPEYYPTRTELAILDTYRNAIALAAGIGGTLVDLGAGNCEKATHLFPALRPAHYVPIDISADFLHNAVAQLQHRFPEIQMHEVAMDFSHDLHLPECVPQEQRLFFYPGSSIGNFDPESALAFLQRVRASCATREGGVLIGVDLVKEIPVLEAAYDDELGVTAAFNLNVLRQINQLIGADFQLGDWQHVAKFNELENRIEMHLVARHAVLVQWPGGAREFAAGESIHTENSYKYTRDRLLALLEQAGFSPTNTWCDANNWFMVCHARAH